MSDRKEEIAVALRAARNELTLREKLGFAIAGVVALVFCTFLVVLMVGLSKYFNLF